MNSRYLRLGCGGCFFVVTTALAAILFLLPLPNFPTTWRLRLLFLLSVAALALLTKWLFRKSLSHEARLAKLEARGLVQSAVYRAKRAFKIQAWEDEGPHYFLELEDERVLYLNDKFLYDYEPPEDEGEATQPRRFPCREFTVRKHKTKDYLIELICADEVFEPEITIEIQRREQYLMLIDLKPNTIIVDQTYDQIKTSHEQFPSR